MAQISSAAVFCGSASNVDQIYKDAATGLGAALAKAGIRLVYGGEKAGLLGLLSGACLAAGGQVKGVIPHSFNERGWRNESVTDIEFVRDLHERKSRMVGQSDAFLVLPGGLGTLDEAVDAIATKYGGEHAKPVIFINTANYFGPVIAALDHMVLRGFVQERHRELYMLAPTPEAAVAALLG